MKEKIQNDRSDLKWLALSKIEADPAQPRKHFSPAELEDLADSIKANGLIQPIVVHRESDSAYRIIAGERRWRAAKMLQMEEIPAIVTVKSDLERKLIALVENIQRSRLNPIEEARAFLRLMDENGLSQDDCAQRVGKDRSTISNLLRLLTLPEQVIKELEEEKITVGHGKALLAIPDNRLRILALQEIHDKTLSVRQAELLAKNFVDKVEKKERLKQGRDDIEYFEDQLRDQLKTKVKITGNPKRGKIEVYYFSVAELERLLAVLRPQTE